MSKGRRLVRMQEGLELQAYPDTRKKRTIGWGHLIKDTLVGILLRHRGGISREVADDLFVLDYEEALDVVRKAIQRDADENDPRDAALISVAFQLGLGDWPTVTHEALTSTGGGPSAWSIQTPNRCQEFVQMVESGEWPARLAGWIEPNAGP